MFGFSRAQMIAFAIMVTIVVVAPFIFYRIVLMEMMCFALFAMGANLLMGEIGLLSLGQSAYFGVGGYVAGYFAQQFGLTPEVCIISGGLAGAALGTMFGWLAIRRQTIYFALITLALGQIAYFVAVQAIGITGGENGIQGIPRGSLFGVFSLNTDLAMYVLVAVIFIGGFLATHRVIHSPFGQVVKAIRENEPRAVSLGYKADQYKWIIFILAATLAGVAGATKALVFSIVTLSDIGGQTSGQVVLMVIVGGIGTIFGPIVGALIVVALEFYLAPLGAWVVVIQGAIFILCVLVFRRGVIGELAYRLKTQL